MSSVIEIINTALIRLAANTINALDEGSVEATLASQIWDNARKATLRAHFWNFAMKEQELAQIVAGSTYNYTYSYQLPSDYLRLSKVYATPDYKIQGSQILSNQTSCTIRYVADVSDTNLWDPSFQDVVAARLAFELAYPLTKSSALMDAMTQLYMAKLQTAKYIDASEDISDPIGGDDVSSLIAVRY